jgi:hypothetical protein
VVDAAEAEGSSQAHRGRKRRRTTRRHKKVGRGLQVSSSEDERDVQQPGSQVVVPPLELAVGGQLTPICAVDFSDKFLRAELELQQRGLFVTVIGTISEVLANEVIVEVARSFQLEEGSMRIHNTMPEDFLLLLHGLPWSSLQLAVQKVVAFHPC